MVDNDSNTVIVREHVGPAAIQAPYSLNKGLIFLFSPLLCSQVANLNSEHFRDGRLDNFTPTNLNQSVCLSAYLLIYSSICLPAYLLICSSIYLPAYLLICSSLYLPAYLLIFLCTYQAISLPLYIPIYMMFVFRVQSL